MKKIAIIGCGAIGSEIARAIDSGTIEAELVALYDIVKEKCVALCTELKRVKPLIVGSIDELLATKPDIVVEAASPEAVKEYAEKVLESGCDLVVLSIGALMDREFLSRIEYLAKSKGRRIYIPSGAIAGIDAIKALKIVGIEKIVLRTRKNPRALKFSNGRQLKNITSPTTVFRGPASEAVKLLPLNVNVSATLSIASGHDIEVEVIADPTVDRNVHEIEVVSKASRIVIRLENVPSPTNPRTSYLAALSVIELLRRLASSGGIEIGT